MRWEDVHGAARAVVYGVLEEQDAGLARALHDEGWSGGPMKPVGVSGPRFVGAPRRKGVYSTSREGEMWFGSPVPEIASVLVAGLAARKEIVWGATRLSVHGFTLDFGEPYADGPVEMETVTPVLVKKGKRDLLPDDAHYMDRLRHNLEEKAGVLGLPAPVGLRVLEAGPRRRFAVSGAPRIGARVRVAMEADGRFSTALRSWGLGLGTIQGFGWIR
jgi:CRISPR-associated endoribonuclease Cas6